MEIWQSSDHSTENDAVNVYEENERLQSNLQTVESSIIQLRPEVASLERQAEQQTVEIETLTQQLEQKLSMDMTLQVKFKISNLSVIILNHNFNN